MTERILITGANGAIGHNLIPILQRTGVEIVALDVNDLDELLRPLVKDFVKASILYKDVVQTLISKYQFQTIFHLASILSTASEKDPEKAQSVNAYGTSILLEASQEYALSKKQIIKIIFPSSIAVYGLPNLEAKTRSGKILENQYLNPITIYGITKLYGEMVGKYYSRNYGLSSQGSLIDFRAVRFPGILSALPVPQTGSSNYASEMIHSASQGEGYESFVRESTRIPFLAMPDAIKALTQIASVDRTKLSQTVYNVTSFSLTAGEIGQLINSVFPDSSISYSPDEGRQRIVDSWPSEIDDSKARQDWGWQPEFDLEKSFKDYLLPEIRNK